MYVRPPVSSCLDLVLFGDDVAVANLLCAVKAEVGLFVDLGGTVGVGRDVFVLAGEHFHARA